MSRTKTILAILLAAIAAGSIAVPVAGAVESEWRIESDLLSELEPDEEELSLSSESFGLSIPELGVDTVCEKGSGSGEIFSGGAAELKVSFSECAVSELPSCEVSEPVSFEAKTELIEPNAEFYEQLLPLKGKSFGTMEFTGEICVLNELSLEITGAVAGTLSGEAEVQQTLQLSEAISNEANADLKAESEAELALLAGEEEAFLSGEIDAKLSGPNESEAWQRLGGKLKLCKNNNLIRCPANEHYPANTRIKATNQVEVSFNLGTAQTRCKESWLEGETTVKEGAQLTGILDTTVFTNCTNESCTVSFKLITEHSYPFYFFHVVGARHMQIKLEELRFSCGAKTCVYRVAMDPTVINGPPATLQFGTTPYSMIKMSGSDANCSAIGSMQGFNGELKYKIDAPNPVYVRT
jgi:hypothetical protein